LSMRVTMETANLSRQAFDEEMEGLRRL